MNKEEILAKSRKENEGCDEFQIQIRDKSIRWTILQWFLLQQFLHGFVLSKDFL